MSLFTLYRIFWLRLRISFYTLALQQIDPSHSDVPDIVRTLCRLSDQLDELKGKA